MRERLPRKAPMCLGLLLIVGLLFPGADAWFAHDYERKTVVYINATLTQAVPQVPISVRFRVSSTIKFNSTDGTSLRFFSFDETKSFPFEIDTFDPTGATESRVWVLLDLVAGSAMSANRFWMYHDNSFWTTSAARGIPTAPTNVWSRYLGVYHGNIVSNQLVDASQSFANLDLNGHGSSVVGAIGTGLQLDGAGLLSNTSVPINTGSQVNIETELWMKVPSCSGNPEDEYVILAVRDPVKNALNEYLYRLTLTQDCNKLLVTSGELKTGKRANEIIQATFDKTIEANTWIHVAFAVQYRSEIAKQQTSVYVNGELTGLLVKDIVNPITLGIVEVGGPYFQKCFKITKNTVCYDYEYYGGVVDELRISAQGQTLGEAYYGVSYQSQARTVTVPQHTCRRPSPTHSSAILQSAGVFNPSTGSPETSIATARAGSTVDYIIVPHNIDDTLINRICIPSVALSNLMVNITSWDPAVSVPSLTPLAFKDSSNPYMFASAIPTKVGTYLFKFLWRAGITFGSTNYESVSYHNVTIVPGFISPSATNVVLDPAHSNGISLSIVGNGTDATFIRLTLFDQYGNAQGELPASSAVSVSVPSAVSAQVLSAGYATYDIRLSSDTPSTGYVVQPIVNGTSLQPVSLVVVDPPSNTTINPGGVPSPSESNSGTDNSVVVGGSLGGVMAAGALVALVFFLYRRRKKQLEEAPPDFSPWAFQLNEKVKVPLKMQLFGNQAHDALLELMQEESHQLGEAIALVVPKAKLNEALKAVMFVYQCSGQTDKCLTFVKSRITDELAEAMSKGSSNLFRTDNSATKSMNIFMRMLGLPYLYNVVGDLIRKTNDTTVELDPTRMERNADADLARYSLLQLTQRTFVNIINSLPQMPFQFRIIANHLDWEVRRLSRENNVDDADKLPQIALAGMIFLRFFCPAISAPSAFGIIAERPDADKRRLLTLVTKTLQNLANGVQFGSKEAYMQQLNDFMVTNQSKIEKYFQEAAVIPVKTPFNDGEGVEAPKAAVPWALNVLFRILHSNLAEIMVKLHPSTRGKLMSVFALSLPHVPKKSEWTHSGYLIKQGGRIKTWKRRFFVLKDKFLWYLKSEDADSPNGVICLEGCSLLETENGFAIDHPHSRTYYIRYDDEDIDVNDSATTPSTATGDPAMRQGWLTALNLAIKLASRPGEDDEEVPVAAHNDLAVRSVSVVSRAEGKRTASDARKALAAAINRRPDPDADAALDSNPMFQNESVRQHLTAMHAQTSSMHDLQGTIVEESPIDLMTSSEHVALSRPSLSMPPHGYASDDESKEEQMELVPIYQNGESQGEPDAYPEAIGDWSVHYTDDGVPYYYNMQTQETTWDAPACFQ